MDLVVGGAGFLGSHVVDALTTSGRNVRVLDTFQARAPGDDPSTRRRTARAFGPRVEIVEGLEEPGGLDRALIGIKRVIHAGALTGARRSLAEPARALSANVHGTSALLDAMERARIPRLVLISTAQVYGESPVRPSRESDPPRPCNPFGASMVAAEALASAWQSVTRGSVVIVRPTAVYGPRLPHDTTLRRLIAALDSEHGLPVFGTGETRRDRVHVQDVVRMVVAARQIESCRVPAVFNACTGVATTTLELIASLRTLTGRRARVECLPAQPGDPSVIWADPTEATRTLQIRAEVPLERGLEQTITWLRKNR